MQITKIKAIGQYKPIGLWMHCYGNTKKRHKIMGILLHGKYSNLCVVLFLKDDEKISVPQVSQFVFFPSFIYWSESTGMAIFVIKIMAIREQRLTRIYMARIEDIICYSIKWWMTYAFITKRAPSLQVMLLFHRHKDNVISEYIQDYMWPSLTRDLITINVCSLLAGFQEFRTINTHI